MINKRYFLVYIFLITILAVSAFAQRVDSEITADILINNSNKIDKITIYYNHSSTPIAEVSSTKGTIEIIKKVSNIKVEKLSKKQDAEFTKNGERMYENGIIVVEFLREDQICGKFIIWENGDLYIVNMPSMKDTTRRTIAYKAKERQPSVYIWLKTLGGR